MKMKLLARTIVMAALFPGFFLTGCSWHKKPKSSAKIIREGDPNPFITINPERAGERVIER